MTVPGETFRACASSPVPTGLPVGIARGDQGDRLDVVFDGQTGHGAIRSPGMNPIVATMRFADSPPRDHRLPFIVR